MLSTSLSQATSSNLPKLRYGVKTSQWLFKKSVCS